MEYLEKVAEYCKEHGVVRRETSFKSIELHDRGMRHIENWTGESMNNVIKPYQFHKKLNIEETRFDGVSEQLQRCGYDKRTANRAELVHTAWVQKKDYRKLIGSKATFYRYRKMLLAVGVDISNPCDISCLTMRAARSEWKELEMPRWYVSGQQTYKQAA